MLHAIEQIPGVLHHGEVHLHLDLDGAAVDVVGVGAAVSGRLGDLALLALALVVRDDRLEAHTLFVEFTAKPFER